MKERADRPAHAMHQRDAGIGERHPRGRRAEHHRLARGAVLRLGAGGADVAGDEAHRVFCEAVGERAGAAADIGLDRMGQAVDPGVGGQPQRHRQGQLKIDDRRRRAAGEPGDQHLLVGLGIGDDGKAGDLRAGARRGRDRDDRRAGSRDLVRHLVVAQMSAIGEQHRHALRGVDRAAAADRHQAVEIAGVQNCGSGVDDLGRRVRDGVGKNRTGESPHHRAAPSPGRGCRTPR